MTASRDGLERFYSVIPAGGIGSRLWPLSRADAPKFLHDLTGTGKTLLRATWDRLVPLSGEDRIMVVTGRSHRRAVLEQIPELDESNIVLEPDPRESSAAIALAAAILRRREPDVIIGSFAADHVITDAKRFEAAVAEAVAAADAGYIATIGITPTSPAIGFGYIRCAGALGIGAAPRASRAAEFTEKPERALAEEYLASGNHLWNAGMFISRADVLLDQLAETEPELHAGIEELADAWDTPQRVAAIERVWPRLKKIAIDYSVAEPAAAAGRLAVIPGDFGWDDVGDFAAVGRLQSGGRPGDLAILGEGARVLADASSGIVVAGSGRLVSLIGVDDIVVVDTPDALLVTTTANAQRVKSVVDALKLSGQGDIL